MIFIGPIEISNYYRELHRALNNLNVKSDLVLFNEAPFLNKSKKSFFYLSNLIQTISLKKNNAKFLNYYLLAFLVENLRIIYFLYAIFKYKTFIFTFGQSLLYKNMDLPILKFFNKQILFNVGHGDESRPAYLSGGYFDKFGTSPSNKVIHKFTRDNHLRVKKIQKYADKLISSRGNSHFLSKNFFDFLEIGIPSIDKLQESFVIDKQSSDKILLTHIPSNIFTKGTNEIDQIIDELKQRNLNFDYIKLTDVPNDEALEVIKKSHIVIDQMYTDTPINGIGVEAMSLGCIYIAAVANKEAILKNYHNSSYFRFVNSLCADKGEVLEKLTNLFFNREERVKISLKALSFVKNEWSNEKIAARYLDIINNTYSKDWIDPMDLNYIYGGGLNPNALKETLKSYINELGEKKMYLDHRKDILNDIKNII